MLIKMIKVVIAFAFIYCSSAFAEKLTVEITGLAKVGNQCFLNVDLVDF